MRMRSSRSASANQNRVCQGPGSGVMNRYTIGLLFAASMLLVAATANGQITGITYTTTSPMFGGTSFGSVGQYEQLDGTVTGELDPDDPHNEIIQDIKLAPRNAHGKVEYSMTFSLLKPIDLSKSNHTLIYDVVNRGNKVISGTLNVGGSATAAGDGFLENHGFMIVWAGWQADVLAGGSPSNIRACLQGGFDTSHLRVGVHRRESDGVRDRVRGHP